MGILSVTAAQDPQDKSGSLAVLISPRTVKSGEILRVLAAGEEEVKGLSIELQGSPETIPSLKTKSGGGPPYWWSAEFRIPQNGNYTLFFYTHSLLRKKKILSSQRLSIPTEEPRQNPGRSVWPVELEWTRGTENLYSAWLDALFHDDDERATWKALHDVTRNPEKNILYNHLRLGEDSPGGKNAIDLEPDCADNPYFLRAYFAWKLRLPFGFSECSRGTLYRGPECNRWLTNAMERTVGDEARACNLFFRLVMNTIQSGSSRTMLNEEKSDFYPVPLTRRDLRPGVLFADCYGHSLVIVRWIPQTEDHPGELYAVDAQPDGTIGIKRFWQGNFLFKTDEVIGAPGFKAFRPIVPDKSGLRLLRNSEIAKSENYGNFSLQQQKMPAAEFYDTMERLINPQPLDPKTALYDLFKAFHEQLLVRVLSVSNGEDYARAHPGSIIPMPSGPSVFETMGLWEDFSTPNRDLRLLIAIDALSEFPDRVVKLPKLYKLPKKKTPGEVKEELEELHKKWAKEMSITYIRSNRTRQTLTLEEILRRRDAFEMAYNPNDCAEIRWGAPEGSAEFSSCNRRAPEPQQQRMKAMRQWFHKRFHPME